MSQARSGMSRGETVSKTVVEAVSEAEGVQPEELTPPLYEVIDPDALGRLFAATSDGTRRHGTVNFVYRGYEVTVRDDGTVSVVDGESTAE